MEDLSQEELLLINKNYKLQIEATVEALKKKEEECETLKEVVFWLIQKVRELEEKFEFLEIENHSNLEVLQLVTNQLQQRSKSTESVQVQTDLPIKIYNEKQILETILKKYFPIKENPKKHKIPDLIEPDCYNNTQDTFQNIIDEATEAEIKIQKSNPKFLETIKEEKSE